MTSILFKGYTRYDPLPPFHINPPRQIPVVYASADTEQGLGPKLKVRLGQSLSPSWLHVSHQQLSLSVTRQHSFHYKDSLQLLPHLGPQSVTVFMCKSE